jgi:dienelactone hydrolase
MGRCYRRWYNGPVEFSRRLRNLEGVETVEYAPGRLVDLVGDQTQPTVLIWHGMQSNARASIRRLAEHVAGHGFSVVVPDWDSHSDDGGRGDLIQSVHFAQGRDAHGDGLTLVGWSMGGVAAAGLTLHAIRLDVRLRHTVCLAGAFAATDPISGDRPATALADSGPPSPFTLLHGIGDDVVPVSASRQFATALEQHGWPVQLVELDADHGSIAGARYDQAADRYSAADDPRTLAVVVDVAARIAATAG